MRIYKTVIIEKEVGVDITPEDYYLTLVAEGDSRDFMAAINTIFQFFESMKPEAVDMLNDEQKGIVYDFMKKATERFKVD